MRVVSLVAVGFLSATPLLAQTAPCGRTVVVADIQSRPSEARFLPAPPEHVKACALKALPAVAAVLEREEGLTLTAKTDSGGSMRQGGLFQAWMATNKAAGVKGIGRGTLFGEFAIELRPETRDGVSGTNIKIDFRRKTMGGVGSSKNGATPLIEEIACLSGLLSPSDPLANPRGFINTADPIEDRTVTLPEGTPLKVILRDPLNSKDVVKKGKDTQVVFEVAADVSVDGVPLIRKGALGLGRFTDVKAAGRFGRSADLAFVIEHVTAVDGQSVAVTGAAERQRNRGTKLATPDQFVGVAGGSVTLAVGGSLLAGFLTKGFETVIRAGTTFDVEMSGAQTIRVGK
jgi:hypothetical protein